MSPTGTASNLPTAFTVEQVASLSNEEAIQICQDNYPDEFKCKKILTLVIAIGALAFFIIPAVAIGLTALSVCTFEVGLLAVTPIALLGISILIKVIDDKTLFWSGKLAHIIIQQHADKAKSVDVKLKDEKIP